MERCGCLLEKQVTGIRSAHPAEKKIYIFWKAKDGSWLELFNLCICVLTAVLYTGKIGIRHSWEGLVKYLF